MSELNVKRFKHIFFDVDQTLTRSRSLIESDMKVALSALATAKDVITVSGATAEQTLKQITPDFLGKIYMLTQNGNYAKSKGQSELWRNELSSAQKQEIANHIASIRNKYRDIFSETDEADLVQDRGCQISFSLLGHNANLEKKEKFDPKGDRRAEILTDIPFASKNLEVKIGGTTCFDYFERGKNKGHNVRRLINTLGWNIADALYIGDALYPGGNDETVIGVCDTFQVKSPTDTLAAIRKMV